jgi:hypothetical protein
MDKMSAILKKSPKMRTAEEVTFISKIIGNIKFFKEAQELTEIHLFEICKNLEIKNHQIGENAITFDEVGEHFYVILKGSVAVNVANPLIKYWRDKHREYLKLKKWKIGFDQKLENLLSKCQYPDIVEEEFERILE